MGSLLQMSRRTGRITRCGGKRRKLGSLKLTGRWINTGSRRMPSSSSPLSTNCCACSCPTWNTSRWKSTSPTGSSRLFLTSAKPSVSAEKKHPPGELPGWFGSCLSSGAQCLSCKFDKSLVFSGFEHSGATLINPGCFLALSTQESLEHKTAQLPILFPFQIYSLVCKYLNNRTNWAKKWLKNAIFFFVLNSLP